MKPPLLFLSHRLPYPPNKGDKVRSYHFLRRLCECYRVHLGTFIDDPADAQYVESVQRICAGVHVERLTPAVRRAVSLVGLLGGEALTLPYFRTASMQRWVNQIVRDEQVDRAFCFSSPMAQ